MQDNKERLATIDVPPIVEQHINYSHALGGGIGFEEFYFNTPIASINYTLKYSAIKTHVGVFGNLETIFYKAMNRAFNGATYTSKLEDTNANFRPEQIDMWEHENLFVDNY